MRDEFSKDTIDKLAKRVGGICSNPRCRASTSGPSTTGSKAINVGVAAHITAASPEGPRYDASLSPEARKNSSNGIWLCQKCAKLIDSDEIRYTVNVIRHWKDEAEDAALRRIEGTLPIDDCISHLNRRTSSSTEGAIGKPSIPPDYPLLRDMCGAIDHRLLRSIRDHAFISKGEIARNYEEMIDVELANQDTNASQVLSALRNRRFCEGLISTLPEAGLEVLINPDLSAITFSAEDQSLRIALPALLWDCTCGYPREKNSRGLSQSKCCPIHSSPNGSIIETRFFGGGLVDIRHDDISVLWHDGPEFWPPAIDSLHFVSVLDREGAFNLRAPRVLDLGCGTGFLGIAAALRNPHTSHVAFADWLMIPLVFAAINWCRNGVSPRISSEYLLGLNTHWPHRSEPPGRFDLAICNPPYLPIPNEHRHIGLSSTVAGTELMEHFVSLSAELASTSFISFSSLVEQEAQQVDVERSRRFRQVAEFRVPFRVRQALSHREYLDYLVKERGLEYDSDNLHPYWHRVTVWRLDSPRISGR